MQKSEESDKKGISQEQLDAISAQIRELAAKTFHNMDLSSELISSAQMLLLGTSTTQDPAKITKDYITNNLFPKAVDSVFAAYQQDCFRFCLSKTQDGHLSDDIAQEAIKLLLLSKKKIKTIGAWLMQVTYNLLCRHYKDLEKEAQLYERLSLEATTFEKWLESGDILELKELDAALAEQLLKSDEYQQYHEVNSYGSIKDYAAANKISEATARKRKEVALRNLKSIALRGMGWRDSPGILNYNQYHAIQKFIREVIKMCSGDEDVKWIKSLNREYAEEVKNIKFIAKWGISAKGGRRYILNLFTLLDNGQPFMLTFNIALNKRNSTSIQEVKVNQLITAIPTPATARVPMDKGRSIWTHEQIMSLLKGN